jgi:hypothetical protein
MLHALSTLALVAMMSGFQANAPRADRTLPAFQVTSPDGTTAASTQLSPESQWLLVYVNPASATTKRLLQAMRTWDAPELVSRTVLIFQGRAAEAQTFMDASLPEELRGMRWYADPDRSAWNALHLTGSPVLIGVANGRSDWSLSGVLGDPAALKSVVLTWVRY